VAVERKDQTVVMSMMEAGWCFCANVTPTLAKRALESFTSAPKIAELS
jgi:hypothetical protein